MSGEASTGDEENEEVEIITLEDVWEDFEPQVPKSAQDSEDEKGSLRDELKGILDNFKNFQPFDSSSSKQSTSATTIQDDEIQFLQSKKSIVHDDDDIEIIQPIISKSKGKMKVSSPSVWKCLVCYTEVRKLAVYSLDFAEN
jgi:hypothetical protein